MQMAEHSKSRIEADAAFLKTQTKPPSPDRILSQTDTINQARDANTARLKEQRLNKEALDRATAAAAPPKPTARKRTQSA
jgi:septation ring formation regulator EzrA